MKLITWLSGRVCINVERDTEAVVLEINRDGFSRAQVDRLRDLFEEGYCRLNDLVDFAHDVGDARIIEFCAESSAFSSVIHMEGKP